MPEQGQAAEWAVGADSVGAVGDAEKVPATVAGRLGRIHSVDVAGVPVRRGPGVSARANRLGARGFTEGGVVHLPDEAGDLEAVPGAALLAHELTHAAQQRALGMALPAPGSPEGQRLEEEAVAVERWFTGGQAGLPPVRHLTGPPEPHVIESWVPVQLAATGGPEPAPAEPPQASSPAGLAEALRALAAEHSVPDEDGGDADERTEDEPDRTTLNRLASIESTMDGLLERIGEDPPRRWLDLDNSIDLDELAQTLYVRLVDRLRFEVLVQRERSGTLMDFR
jgi:hypothetical protein